MQKFLILLVSIGFITTLLLANPSYNSADHGTWNELLRTYVSTDGKVDYNGFKKDKNQLNAYLQMLSEHVPDKTWPDNERLAYWINAYNAFTVALIIDHYPVKSIMDIENAWDIKFIQLEDITYTLNEIEHEIIRKGFEEPRIHFALVCAAVSCPVLLNEAYLAESLDSQLQKQGKKFINDPNQNDIETNKAKVSQIFNWFGEDFTKKGTLIDFLNQFSKTKLDAKANIEFMEYNWDLNQ